jgi:beta-glucanase (GH16 family)
MKNTLLLTFAFLPILATAQVASPYAPDYAKPARIKGMKLVFSEEFNYTGKPDSAIWSYENGFTRNQELQWYQSDNANCADGRLIIEGRKTDFPNPNYVENSHSWKRNRKTVNYTAASITTSGKKTWKFGRFEIRARIDTAMGAWPAIWLLGVDYEWPSCGEIDMLEYYPANNTPTILANVVSGTTKRYDGKWSSVKTPLKDLTQNDKNWVRKYHVWRMDWTQDSINLYIDGRLLNSTLVKETVNPDGTQPFLQPQYMLLNLSLGSNGGDPLQSKFPIKFEVDYVRVYQQQ